MIWTRWRGAILPVIALAAVVACRLPAAPAPPGPPVAAVPQAAGRQVQVIAHPDDDILFMNPDLAAGLRNGQPTLSIYLTGGESDMPNPTEYASRRQDGTRAAYARMAGAPDRWIRHTVAVPGNRLVEVDDLEARPAVQVAFLNLPENNDPAATGGKYALTRLWEDRGGGVSVNTLVQDAGTVRDAYPYRHDDVVDALVALLETFRPSVLRTQDAQPDTRYQPQWVGFHDHPDHVVAARFTREATQRYLSRPANRALVVDYRDYNVADSPVDLSVADQRDKKDYFSVYLRHDRGANLDGSYRDWTERSYYRYPPSGSWAAVDGQGEVHAFAVSGTRLVHWWRDGAGRWRGPELSATPAPLRPTLTMVRDPGGRLVLVAQSWDGAQVLAKRQLAPAGGWAAEWTSLSNPHEHQPGRDTAQVGVPAAVVDEQGRLAVFLKNADGAVSARRERTPGSNVWDGWNDLGGSDVQDGITAVTDQGDRLHVLAATPQRVLHWQEREPGGPFEPARTPFRGLVHEIRPAGPPAAARATDGTARAFVRTDDSGALAGVRAAPALGWQVPARLPNPGGMAPPVVVTREGRAGPEFLLFVRNSNGGVSATSQPGDGAGWTDLGGHLLSQPAAVRAPNGSVMLLAIGADGNLVTDQSDPDAAHGLAFHGWQPATP